MGHAMKEHFSKEKKTGKEKWFLMTELIISGILRIVRYMVMVSTDGTMVNIIKVNGNRIECVDRDWLFGLMEESTRVIIKMIRKMVTVFLHGMKKDTMRGIGKMENNMEQEDIAWVINKGDRDFGKMGKELNGLIEN